MSVLFVSKFKAGDKVRFRFNDTEARESVVMEVTGAVPVIWVADPDEPDNVGERYPCYEHELEAL